MTFPLSDHKKKKPFATNKRFPVTTYIVITRVFVIIVSYVTTFDKKILRSVTNDHIKSRYYPRTTKTPIKI